MKNVIPAKAGTQFLRWFPTFVGTTSGCRIKSGMTKKVHLWTDINYAFHNL